VGGAPGAGKTTLATALAAALGSPLLPKDVIKEGLMDALGADGTAPTAATVERIVRALAGMDHAR